MTIKLASNLTLTDTAATDTFAFFGARGTGKTYAAGRMVEGFYDAGIQVVWVDPVGVAYGLRLAADGRGLGLDVPVFGGIHADVPLEPTAGELVAGVVVEQRASLILDVSMLTLGQQHKFILAFASALFHLKKSDRSPVHLVFDEAHEYLPQQPMGNEAEMLHAVKRLWKMGRNFGIGASMISQRPAEVNKGVVNLTERMFCGRLKGAQDRKAMESWAASNDADADALDRLGGLAKGELLTWTERGVEAVRFFPKRTFDASKTPEAGDYRPTGPLPRIDLDAVREAMAQTIEAAAANDPKVLRARIADLERRLEASAARGGAGETTLRADVDRLRQELAQVREIERNHVDQLALFRDLFGRIQNLAASGVGAEAVVALPEPRQDAPAALPARTSPLPAPAQPRASRAPRAPSGGEAKMEARVRRVLTVLAQFGGVVSRRKTGAVAGYPPSGSSMRNALAVCRSMGWAEDVGSDGLRITTEGRKALGPFDPLPTGAELRDWWIRELPEQRAREVFRVLVGAGGRPVPRERLGEESGYPHDGSSMRNALSTLRAREIVQDHHDGSISVAAELL